MKKTLKRLPKQKRNELTRIARLIREKTPDLQMLILFGSYARGKWVEDICTKGNTIYEYISDFDILAVVETNRTANSTNHWHRLDKSINAMHLLTPVTIIAHDINFVNRKLKQGQYFFTDIKKEGIVLYDSKKFKLARRRKLDPDQRAELAKESFKQWFKSAKDFYTLFGTAFEKKLYKKAAFLLHQTTEALYAAIMLVFKNYRPKSHDLKKLSRLTANYDRAFFGIFPQGSNEEKRLFDLLNRAYVEARYVPEYKITKTELEYLAARVKALQKLTKRICAAKIKSFV